MRAEAGPRDRSPNVRQPGAYETDGRIDGCYCAFKRGRAKDRGERERARESERERERERGNTYTSMN